MPWLHRLACLRDDVVFLIYLYQKWIYPEDKRRRNEFGQVGELEEEEDKEEESDSEPIQESVQKASTAIKERSEELRQRKKDD